MIGDKKISVVLPAYNAEKTLKKTFREIPFDIVDHVILVDDKSSDMTLEVARELGIEHIIEHRTNLGYGGNQKSCYRKALEIAGGPTPSTCVMVDDQDRNLAPARRLGMHTVLVGPDVEHRAAHSNIAELHHLPSALNGLLE